MSNRRGKSRMRSDKEKKQSQALSLSLRTGRYPAVDMSSITDVSTLACVELSRSIMTRPEVNTGSLFAAIAASRNEVNKSDAVIVVTAAILETIGSKRAAEKLLSKSGTVSKFYEQMNLRDDIMRDSFVVLLFALSPEFVKMIESAVKVSIERVQEVTDAPHAGTKMLEAAGELARTEAISVSEHNSIMRDFAKGRVLPSLESTFVSAGQVEPDGIQISDSASNIGASPKDVQFSNLQTSDILSYLRESIPANRQAFSGVFPGAKPPISPVTLRKKQGLGFAPRSVITADNDNDSGISGIMNNLLPKRKTPVRRLTSESEVAGNNFMTSRSVSSKIANSSANSDSTDANIIWADAMVTMEDVTEKLKETKILDEGRSFAPTAMTEEEELLDLLGQL